MEIIQYRWGPKPLKTETLHRVCVMCGKPLTIVVAREGQMASPTAVDFDQKRLVCAECYDSEKWVLSMAHMRIEGVA